MEQEEGAHSARNALSAALSTIQRLFAPFLPFVTEETWSWWMQGSVHTSVWPSADALRAKAGQANTLVTTVASDIMRDVRRAKSDARLSMKTKVSTLSITDTEERLDALSMIKHDLMQAGHITELMIKPGDGYSVDVILDAQAILR